LQADKLAHGSYGRSVGKILASACPTHRPRSFSKTGVFVLRFDGLFVPGKLAVLLQRLFLAEQFRPEASTRIVLPVEIPRRPTIREANLVAPAVRNGPHA
jgi:hypothetical protein